MRSEDSPRTADGNLLPQFGKDRLPDIARRQLFLLHGSLREPPQHLRTAGGFRRGRPPHLGNRARPGRLFLGQRQPHPLPQGHGRRRELPALRRQYRRHGPEGLHGHPRCTDPDHRPARGDRLADNHRHEPAQPADLRPLPPEPQHGRDDDALRKPRRRAGLADRPRRQAARGLRHRRRRQLPDPLPRDRGRRIPPRADDQLQGVGLLRDVHTRQQDGLRHHQPRTRQGGPRTDGPRDVRRERDALYERHLRPGRRLVQREGEETARCIVRRAQGHDAPLLR